MTSQRVDIRWSLPGRSGEVCLAGDDQARSYRAMVDREDLKRGLKRQWTQTACRHAARADEKVVRQ